MESLSSPVSGTVKNLTEVRDEVFATKMMGDGVAIAPIEGNVIAPCDGEITMMFPTGHAIGLRTFSRQDILIHVGIDTVELNGDGFTPYVKAGQQVLKKDRLLGFDLDKIKAGGYDIDTMMIITSNIQEIKIGVLYGSMVEAGDDLLTVQE